MNSNDHPVVRIHQLLHGYDEGHRLLSGSIKPDKEASKTLLELSDLSGQGSLLKSYGYLTGYPLSTLGVYALAWTWPATELSRPGCVWTHSLLIDFEDLSLISDIEFLELFCRPQSNALQKDYSNPFLIPIKHNSTSIMFSKKQSISNNSDELSITSNLVKEIYGYPDARVFMETPQDIAHARIALNIWKQQWPKLKRNFRFCTWSLSDRSRDGNIFDLQFIPAINHVSFNINDYGNIRLVDVGLSCDLESVEWIKAVARDILSNDSNTHFRAFLKRYGSEVHNARRAFKPLALSWMYLYEEPQMGVEYAIKAITPISSEANLLSAQLLQIISTQSKHVDFSSDIYSFLLSSLDLPYEYFDHSSVKEISSFFWNTASEILFRIICEKDIQTKSILFQLVKEAPVSMIIESCQSCPEALYKIIDINRDITKEPALWDAPSPMPSIAAESVIKLHQANSDVLDAMVQANNSNTPSIAINLFGFQALSKAISTYSKSEMFGYQRLLDWLKAASHEPKYLLDAIACGDIKSLKILSNIASLIDYDTPSMSSDVDEWVSGLENSIDDLGQSKLELYSYLMLRALSTISPEPGKLISITFDFIHDHMCKSKYITGMAKTLLDKLPYVPFWKNWDRAYRLRSGVLRFFINNQLPPDQFLSVTRSECTFEQLVNLAKYELGGKAYLHDTYEWVCNNRDRSPTWIASVLESAL